MSAAAVRYVAAGRPRVAAALEDPDQRGRLGERLSRPGQRQERRHQGQENGRRGHHPGAPRRQSAPRPGQRGPGRDQPGQGRPARRAGDPGPDPVQAIVGGLDRIGRRVQCPPEQLLVVVVVAGPVHAWASSMPRRDESARAVWPLTALALIPMAEAICAGDMSA